MPEPMTIAQERAVKEAEKAYRAACAAETEHPCRAHAQATDVASRAVYQARRNWKEPTGA